MIKVQKLRKVYKVGDEKVVALNNINLEIEDGEFCCITGTSGSGKSTLLNLLAGLEKPTKGKVVIQGKLVTKMNEKQLAKFRQDTIGFIFQSYNLMPTMTAVENVAFPLMFRGVDRKVREKRAKKILTDMGLGDRLNHKPGEMSGGQQQRVGIARAFVGKPKVIFADEPTGNLDSATTRQVMELLIDISKKNNITFVMVTHDPNLAAMAPRVVKLIDGQIVSDKKNGVEMFVPDSDAPDAEMNIENEAVAAEAETHAAVIQAAPTIEEKTEDAGTADKADEIVRRELRSVRETDPEKKTVSSGGEKIDEKEQN